MKASTTYCELCGKTAQSANNRPKSLHKTKRLMRPNLQKWNDLMICNRCRKTIKVVLAETSAEKTPAKA